LIYGHIADVWVEPFIINSNVGFSYNFCYYLMLFN